MTMPSLHALNRGAMGVKSPEGLIGLSLCSMGLARAQGDQAAARKPVDAFYAAFDQGFTGPADFAAEDWAHINPNGGWTRGRAGSFCLG